MPAAKPKLPILNRAHPLARGLVGAWLMYEGSGIGARDLSGRGNHGTIVNAPPWVVSGWGRAIDLNGSTQYVNCGNSSVLNPTAGLTLVAAIIFDSVAGTDNFVITRDDNSLGRAYSFGRRSNRLELQISGAATIRAQGATLSAGVLYSIAATGSATTGWRTYLNGIADGSASWAAPNSTTGATNIGRRTYSGAESYFDGKISCAYIYNRALTPNEIRALHIDPYQAFWRSKFYGPLLTGAAVTSTVRLTWQDNSDNETLFSIERSTTSATAGFAEIDTAAANAEQYDDTGLADGTYWYRVRAYDGVQYSDYSNVTEITIAS